MSENPAAFDQPDDERPVEDLEVPDEEAPADGPADPYVEGGYQAPAVEEEPDDLAEDETAEAPDWDEEE